ncbi:MAG: DUF349 domain-containing protein [Candidatus Nanopelagicales bacterium]|nr:DUF349 domain-containing protein [Candidatus Nanopelagicales bacterium]
MTNPLPGAIPTPAAMRRPTPAAVVAAPAASDPSKFGRVDADGTVVLLAPEGEVVVGQWVAGPPAEGLAFFGRKFDDLVVELDLTSARLSDGHTNAEQATLALTHVREAVTARSYVGDTALLLTKISTLESAIEQAKVAQQAAKAAQKAAANAQRDALAVEAESLADSTNWKTTSERFATMIEEWKSLPRMDRTSEQEIWKRISAARAAFDKRRRAHFNEVESQRKDATSKKRELIASAEALATSTDWVNTSKKLRDLMQDWKNAPRTSKRDEDKLWKRFKAAQDAFYTNRVAVESAAEEELKVNVPAKEALVVEAESINIAENLKGSKQTLRSIQDRWDKAGDLPKADRDRLERRLKKVEDAIRSEEANSWKRSNPESRARAESTANAFADGLAKLEAQLAAAKAAGKSSDVTKLEATIASTKALLDAASAAAKEFKS